MSPRRASILVCRVSIAGALLATGCAKGTEIGSTEVVVIQPLTPDRTEDAGADAGPPPAADTPAP